MKDVGRSRWPQQSDSVSLHMMPCPLALTALLLSFQTKVCQYPPSPVLHWMERRLKVLLLKHAQSRKHDKLCNTINGNQLDRKESALTNNPMQSKVSHAYIFALKKLVRIPSSTSLCPCPQSPKRQQCYNLSYLLPGSQVIRNFGAFISIKQNCFLRAFISKLGTCAKCLSFCLVDKLKWCQRKELSAPSLQVFTTKTSLF